MAYKQLKNKMRAKYGNKCMLCRRKLKLNETTFHHILPLSKGGKSTEENGALLCEPCQSILHTFEYEEDGYKRLTEKILKNKGKASS